MGLFPNNDSLLLLLLASNIGDLNGLDKGFDSNNDEAVDAAAVIIVVVLLLLVFIFILLVLVLLVLLSIGSPNCTIHDPILASSPLCSCLNVLSSIVLLNRTR